MSNENANLSPSNKPNKSFNERFLEKELQLNSGTLDNNRYKRNFVSANVINLSSRHLSKNEISFLSKGLKFKIKEEIEVYGRKLRLIWHFSNDQREFDVNTGFDVKP